MTLFVFVHFRAVREHIREGKSRLPTRKRIYDNAARRAPKSRIRSRNQVYK